MPHRPLLALAIITCLGSAFLVEIRAGETELAIIGTMSCAALITGWIGHHITLLRSAAGVLTSCWIVGQLPAVWIGEAGSGHQQLGRIEGRIDRVRTGAGRTTTLTVEGEVDLLSTPACMARIHVTVISTPSGSRLKVDVGDHVVIVGRCRPFAPTIEPGSFDELRWARSASLMMRCVANEEDVKRIATASWLTTLLRDLRAWVGERCSRHLTPRSAAITYAMLTGDRSMIDRATSQQFAQTGVAHMLSVSGSHVGVLLSILLSVFGPLSRSRTTTICAIAALITYGLFTGMEPPTVRAIIMAMGVLIGRVRERDVDALNLLGAATLIVLLCDPTMIVNTSFLLSTIATYGILVLYPMWYQRLGGHRILRSSMALNLAACGVMTMPSLLLLDTIALAAPMANLIVVPLLSAGMIAGIVLLPCADLPIAGASVAWCLESLIQGAMWCIDVFSAVPSPFTIIQSTVVALSFSVLLIWPCLPGRPRAFVVRVGISIVWFVGALTMPIEKRSTIQVRPFNNGVEIVVVDGWQYRTATITTKYGAVFVRSRDAADPPRLP